VRALLLAALTAGCLADYDPPPELASINLEQGLFDPSRGPLKLALSEPVRLGTLNLALYLGRTNIEAVLCVKDDGGQLPPGCAEEAAPILGPCAANLRASEVTSDGGLRFTCPGGGFTVDANNAVLSLEPSLPLAPFERYALVLAPGLEDSAGRSRKTPLRVNFGVKSQIPCGPTDFQPGFFFTVFDIESPIASQFHFFFRIEVKATTGELNIFGADADPIDPAMTDQKIDRDARRWRADPMPGTGTTVEARGIVADVDGGRVMAVFPFTLDVAVPRVEAPGAELSGRFSMIEVPNAPAGPREVIAGRLSAPNVFLGAGAERAAVGPGRGTATIFRLRDDEAPPLASLLRAGRSIADVTAPFGECE